MADRQSSGRFRVPSASNMLNALAESLSTIKREDDLTDGDLAAILGKVDDQASKYRTGLAEMSVTTFLRGCNAWNGRFANGVLALFGMKLVPVDASGQSDRVFGGIIAELNLAVVRALENDDEIDERELAGMQAVLDLAGRAIDARRAKPKLEAVA